MKKSIFIFTWALAAMAFAPTHSTQTLEVVVIVNGSNPTEKLFPTEVRNYWMRRGTFKSWSSLKTTVLPVDRKGKSPEKATFYSKIVALNEADVEAYFAAKQYQNAETPPVKFASDKDIISYVAENRGAIGFVNASSLTDETMPKVKVVCRVE